MSLPEQPPSDAPRPPEENEPIALMNRLADALSQGQLAPEAQPLAARLAALMPYLSMLPDPAPQCAAAAIALRALTQDSPAIEMATALISGLEWETAMHRNPLMSVLRARTAALPIFLGMLACILTMPLVWAAGALLLGFLRDLSNSSSIELIDATEMLYVAFVGAVGAEVSIMLRISRDWMEPRSSNYQALFLEGFFRPWIGVAFACLALMLVKSGEFLPGIDWNTYTLMAVAFTTGFSERLGDGLVQTAAGMVQRVGAPAEPKAKG